MVNHEWSLDELRHKAEAYCAGAEHCSYEVSSKLQQWGANAEAIASIIAHLKSQRYIDDERYCRAFAHDKLLYQGWGRMKIRAQLLIKHLPSAFIEQALAEMDEQTYQEVLRKKIRLLLSEPNKQTKIPRNKIRGISFFM